jgi:hypothetical protein
MEHQGKHDIAYLEMRINQLGDQLEVMGDTGDLKEMIFNLHRPGWTTPAEYLLVSGIVDVMFEQVNALTTLRQGLITGSRVIAEQADELNPQPLPPGPPQE